ncbi:hypothetical protein BDZ45DRAFT_99273 [Acephala macrosclerotiorum]|nr:hypothetical protein BDZ45DRAFT_99273 [Acephala macrosclerotiorum]
MRNLHIIRWIKDLACSLDESPMNDSQEMLQRGDKSVHDTGVETLLLLILCILSYCTLFIMEEQFQRRPAPRIGAFSPPNSFLRRMTRRLW